MPKLPVCIRQAKKAPDIAGAFINTVPGLFHTVHQLVDCRCQYQVNDTNYQTDPE